MSCATCGAPVDHVDDSGGSGEGDRFKETYECANGHRGWIRGTTGESPKKWKRTGSVFNDI